MNMRNVLRVVLASFIVVGFMLLLSLANTSTPEAVGGPTIRLEAPSFVGLAHAESNRSAPPEVIQKLDDEAGISAYYLSPDPINLNNVRGEFRTIELETAEYIVGSVSVPGYVEHFDAHVYVNIDGTIMAYYLREHPTSEIVDVLAPTINGTKLEEVVEIVASAAGAPSPNVGHYDFRYPNATHMLLIAETYSDGNDFTVELPSSFTYYVRDWALRSHCCDFFRVDGVGVGGQHVDLGNARYGTIAPSKLVPDTQYTITVNDYGVLVILYRVP